MMYLTRRYRFSAAHVLARAQWSAERNREIYGKCANPSGHGHNYVLEVTVEGEVDPQTGRILAIGPLDARVQERVLDLLDHRWLDREVGEFEKRVPTAENIARFVWGALEDGVAPARLCRVRLIETENNWVEYRGEEDAR